MAGQKYVVFGVSRGLGKAIAKMLCTGENIVYGISRSQPDYLDSYPQLRWIEVDLSKPIESSRQIGNIVGNSVIDALIYNVGIWEHKAFEEDYSFEQDAPEYIVDMINTNITSCILSVQKLLGNIKQSTKGKIVLVGSTWGLENHNAKEVTFSATKFALRGIVHSLRENLRPYNIGVSILNLGYLATEYEGESSEEVASMAHGSLIPIDDVLNAIQFILNGSSASCVKEIDMPAMLDSNV